MSETPPTTPARPPLLMADSACTLSPYRADADAVQVDFNKKKKKARRKPKGFEDIYELTGVVLGSGFSGVVKECRDKSTNELFAAKFVSKTDDPAHRDQVFKELDLLRKCEDCPFILKLMNFFETEKDLILVFEKAEGGALLDHIRKRKSFTEKEAALVIRDIATALTFLHNKGIAHRDLKPQNILCIREDSASPAKLCDFNLGSNTDSHATTPPLMTPVGTPEFMSPEIVESIVGQQRTYDKKCDIWSLGVIMYMILCGYPPFSGECGRNCGWKRGEPCEFCSDLLMENIQNLKFDFPAKDWKGVSNHAKDLIKRMLVRDSERITAADILAHPWIKCPPLATPLPSPDFLRLTKAPVDVLDSFVSEANRKQKAMSSFVLGSVHDAPLSRRRATNNGRASLVQTCPSSPSLQHNSLASATPIRDFTSPLPVPSTPTSVLS